MDDGQLGLGSGAAMTGDLRLYHGGLAMMLGDCRWPPGGRECLSYMASEVAFIVHYPRVLPTDVRRAGMIIDKGYGLRIPVEKFDFDNCLMLNHADAIKHWRVVQVS